MTSFLKQLEKDRTAPKAQGALDELQNLKDQKKKLLREGAPKSVIGQVTVKIAAQLEIVKSLMGSGGDQTGGRTVSNKDVASKNKGFQGMKGGGKVYTNQNKRYAHGGKVSGRKAKYNG